MDACIEANPQTFLACLVSHGARILRRSRFGTVALEFPERIALDLATTREEVYARPGALPLVKPARLLQDLARRDFSINAMALPIGGGDLVDPWSGRDDLAGARLRVLHDRSFDDDPTRILRGTRFEARWQFRFDAATEGAARRAIADGALWTVGPDRLRRELECNGSEPRLQPIVARWEELGVWRSLFGSSPAPIQASARWDLLGGPSWLSRRGFWTLLLQDIHGGELQDRAARMRVAAGDLQSILLGQRWARRWVGQDASASLGSTAVDAWLELDPEVRRVLRATSTALSEIAWGALDQAATIVLRVGGDELLAAGVRPGPAVGRALRSTLAARRRGEIAADQELEFARRAIQERADEQ